MGEGPDGDDVHAGSGYGLNRVCGNIAGSLQQSFAAGDF